MTISPIISLSEESKKYREKHRELSKNHPNRLLSAEKTFATAKEKAEVVYKEAKEKGYTIIPAYNPKQKQLGYIAYTEIEDIEIAYNPVWPEEDGEIDGFSIKKYYEKEKYNN